MFSDMKTFVALLSGFLTTAAFVSANTIPQGNVVEVHSVEVYTGGCTASAQATSGGRSMLRVWNFESGAQDGIELSGLQVAALQVADKNLAAADTAAKSAVVYLPGSATEAQRSALLAWVAANGDLGSGPLATKTAEIKFAQNRARISLGVGDQIALKTREIQKCDAGGCGEALWYQPRSKVSDYTVVVNESSTVREPDLALLWKDNGAKSVFVGRFGTDSRAQFHLASLE